MSTIPIGTRPPEFMRWGNTRFQRLVAWAIWRHSPSVFLFTGRRPHFIEAWTGMVDLSKRTF